MRHLRIKAKSIIQSNSIGPATFPEIAILDSKAEKRIGQYFFLCQMNQNIKQVFKEYNTPNF